MSAWLRKRKRKRKTKKEKKKDPSTVELKQQTPGPKQVSVSIKTTKGPKCQAPAQRVERSGAGRKEGSRKRGKYGN